MGRRNINGKQVVDTRSDAGYNSTIKRTGGITTIYI